MNERMKTRKKCFETELKWNKEIMSVNRSFKKVVKRRSEQRIRDK